MESHPIAKLAEFVAYATSGLMMLFGWVAQYASDLIWFSDKHVGFMGVIVVLLAICAQNSINAHFKKKQQDAIKAIIRQSMVNSFVIDEDGSIVFKKKRQDDNGKRQELPPLDRFGRYEKDD